MPQTTMGFLTKKKVAEVLQESVVELNSGVGEQSVVVSLIDTSSQLYHAKHIYSINSSGNTTN